MKRLFFVIISLFFVTVSCSESKPKGILSEKEMAGVMTDVYLTDSYLNTLGVDSGRKVKPALYQSIFDKYTLDSLSFTENLSFYYGNPIALEKVNALAKESLTAQEKDFRRIDSLKQVHLRDSIAQVTNWDRINSELKAMISDYRRDSSEFTFHNNNDSFFNRANLYFYRHPLIKPIIPVVPSDTTAKRDLKIDSLISKPQTMLKNKQAKAVPPAKKPAAIKRISRDNLNERLKK